MTQEEMLADLLAHQYAVKGVPSEEFEDEDFDVDELIGQYAAADDWEDLIRE